MYILFGFLLIIILIVYKKSGAFFKSLFSSVLGGVGALCAVNALSYFIPLSIGLNWFSLTFSAMFSVPGVIFLLMSKVFLF